GGGGAGGGGRGGSTAGGDRRRDRGEDEGEDDCRRPSRPTATGGAAHRAVLHGARRDPPGGARPGRGIVPAGSALAIRPPPTLGRCICPSIRRSSRCSRRRPTRSPKATAGSTSRNGTASARSSSATATRS